MSKVCLFSLLSSVIYTPTKDHENLRPRILILYSKSNPFVQPNQWESTKYPHCLILNKIRSQFNPLRTYYWRISTLWTLSFFFPCNWVQLSLSMQIRWEESSSLVWSFRTLPASVVLDYQRATHRTLWKPKTSQYINILKF